MAAVVVPAAIGAAEAVLAAATEGKSEFNPLAMPGGFHTFSTDENG
jgi:hypothetical protein